jgi:hypothetical protein
MNRKEKMIMATSFEIDIALSDATVAGLEANNYQLYGFKGADGTGGVGVPVIWFASETFSNTNQLQWTEQYGAYTSLTTALAPGVQITASSSAQINLGQQAAVAANGVVSVNNKGVAGIIEVLNTTNVPYSCGVSVVNPATKKATPICAFPLFGKGLDTFIPIELVFLTFATAPVNTGTVIEQSFAPGILIDMTGQVAPVALSFDLNNGWSGPGFTTNYPATTDLTGLLINPGDAQTKSRRAARRARALAQIAA